MKEFVWDEAKNNELMKTRNVSFEQVVAEIAEGRLLDKLKNPAYPGQAIYVVKLNDYIHCVPSVEEGNTIILKTIFPSRKMNRKYKPEI